MFTIFVIFDLLQWINVLSPLKPNTIFGCCYFIINGPFDTIRNTQAQMLIGNRGAADRDYCTMTCNVHYALHACLSVTCIKFAIQFKLSAMDHDNNLDDKPHRNRIDYSEKWYYYYKLQLRVSQTTYCSTTWSMYTVRSAEWNEFESLASRAIALAAFREH